MGHYASVTAETTLQVATRPKQTTPTKASQRGTGQVCTGKRWLTVTFYLAMDMMLLILAETEGFKKTSQNFKHDYASGTPWQPMKKPKKEHPI